MQVRVSGTPVPSRLKENTSTGTSELKVYKLDEDEIKKSRYASVHKNGLGRDETLNAIASGEKLAALERRKGLKPNEIYYWLKKWDLTGVTANEALIMLSGNKETSIKEPVKEIVIPASNYDRVQLPKEVCLALDELRESLSNAEIIRYIFLAHPDQAIRTLCEYLEKVDSDLIIKALVLGYEPELTAEERIKALFKNPPIANTSLHEIYQYAIRDTLRIHGISYDWLDGDAE